MRKGLDEMISFLQSKPDKCVHLSQHASEFALPQHVPHLFPLYPRLVQLHMGDHHCQRWLKR